MTALALAGVFLLASWATVATFSAVRNGEKLEELERRERIRRLSNRGRWN